MRFLQYLFEAANEKHMILTYGRMSPPTIGHEKALNALKDIAKKKKADHLVLISHTHDKKKNPLDIDTKMKHLKRAFPDVNMKATSKEKGMFHHLDDLHSQGYRHITMVVGHDRKNHFEKNLNQYNKNKHFKSIKVISAGKRSDTSSDPVEKISASKMREFAKNNDYHSFANHLPTNIAKNPSHSKELFHDLKKAQE